MSDVRSLIAWRAYLSLILALIVTGGCAPEAPRPVRIGVSFLDIDEPTEMVQRGILLNARPEREKVRWNSAGKSAEKQRGDVDDFLGEPVDVLILQPADTAVLDHAVTRAAERGVPLVWVQEPRLGPAAAPPGIARVATDWRSVRNGLAARWPGAAVVLRATRPDEAAAVAQALGGACPAEADCSIDPAGTAVASGNVSLSLDDAAFGVARIGKPSDVAIALASEACARALLAGDVAGCLDTRPFEIDRTALDRARAAVREGAPPAADAPALVPARLVTRPDAPGLTYRWPHLPLTGGPEDARVLGDGLR